MTYQEALDYIHGRTQFGIKLGLERMRYLLDLCDNPNQKYPIVHIAGTNGKGSVTAMISSVLKVAGYKVGRFTSPHLSSYTERFSINDQNIPKERLGKVVSEIKAALDKSADNPLYGEPTEFEVGTLIAFKYFADEEVDLAVIEVGMGGRIDSTNVVEPLVSGITHIALDHREFLGSTLPDIAKEKAGIIKPRCPVVVGIQDPEVYSVFEKVAASAKAPLFMVGKDFNYRLLDTGVKYTLIEIERFQESAITVELGLLGRHQAANATLAYGLLSIIKDRGFTWEIKDLLQGFATLKWPGRLELVSGNPPILMDGAHNPDGCRVLYDTLEDIFPEYQIHLIIGVLKNRPIEEMVSILAPRITKAYATKVPDPKTSDPSDIVMEFQKYGVEAKRIDEPRNALYTARRNTTNTVSREGNAPRKHLLLLTGSLYLIGYLRPYILKLKNESIRPGRLLSLIKKR